MMVPFSSVEKPPGLLEDWDLADFYGVRQARQPELVFRFSHWAAHWRIETQPMG
ncbi:MAG: hypothetical protein PSW75_09335 [bacterium]|nr:hypothetical protein [bacterium]MDI1334606.1 hypothetical protein [Lacunisphaera sp.]